MIVWYATLVVTVLSSLLVWIVKNYAGKTSLTIREKVLLITAHPDDECMFFAPTLLYLTRTNSSINPASVYLLCLTEGNYYGQGSIRRHELAKSAAILGIPENHVSIVDDRDLPDSPSVEWNEDKVEKYVLETVQRYGIKTIITFDSGGVSGHPNHIAISRVIRKLHQQNSLHKTGVTDVLLLETTNSIRKYSGWLDVMWRSELYVVSDISCYIKAKQAMQSHNSQYVWFRRLYVLFSRYMIINTYTRLITR